MIVSSLPIWAVDVLGSVCMIVLSIACLHLAYNLQRRDRNNIIWTYLFWVCTALTVFAVSRSAGHILKQVLIVGDNPAAWEAIRPYSGAVNTFTFVLVAAFTLFFERTWNIYRQITSDKQDLQSARDKLLYLNQNLENLVGERTAELALSEHKYRRIFEVSRDLILVAAANGRIVDINPSGRHMLGLGEAAARDRSLQDFFLEPSQWQAVAGSIGTSGFVANAEVDLRRSDGSRMRTLLSGSLDRGFPDKQDTIHFLIRDIEQRRLAEEQIAQTDKLASIGQLSAGIAHEINNPLGIILGFTQLLIRHEDPQSEKFQDLKTIEKHVRNCKTIVADLLNFARTSSPKENLIRIDSALEEVLKFIRQHGNHDRIEVVKDFDPAVPPMFLDEEKIKQVFMNLILNARHAMGGRGRLSLSTAYLPRQRQVAITFADTGYGIEKKNLSRIFDPFFTTKPTGEGTGLGLSVSYGIVKNHGGDITVESDVGRGATFTILLPVASPAKGPSHAENDTDRRR
ncbi:MAG: ATP-binding protein [Desulfobacterales bacterium]